MNYFPCNNIGISVNGVLHKGELKLKDEYIPTICPDNIVKPVPAPTEPWYVRGCVSLGGKLRTLSRRGLTFAETGCIATLDKNTWVMQGTSVSGLYNEVGVIYKGYCNVGEDVYVVRTNGSPSTAWIDKVNDDGTTTNISYTPGRVNSARIASFVNSDGDNCILVANYLYTDYAVASYFYNLNTQQWTQISLRLPTGDNYIGNVYSSNEENVVYCISNDGNKMYKYNFSSNTYTDISNWSTLTENENKVSRVNKTYWRIPIVCNGKTYHFLYCNIDVYYSSNANTWQMKDIFVILDENNNIIFMPFFPYESNVLSVCGHDNCIYILCDCKYYEYMQYNAGYKYYRVGKFYKFDPKTCRMYDMSIPHLVIDK